MTVAVLIAVFFSPVAGIILERMNPRIETTVKYEPVHEMSDNWEYQWEDPKNHTFLKNGWKPADSIINPPGRKQNDVLWLKRKFPDIQLDAPAILIDGKGILLTFEMFVDDTKIYQFGRIDPSGKGHFSGLSSHLIDLGNDVSGQTLYLRIFSDYANIGVRGKIFLGSRSSLVQHVAKNDMLYLIIALFMITVGILDLLVYKNSVLTIGSISMNGIFAIGLGFYAINTITLKDFFFYAPAFWFNIYIAGLSLIPIGLMGFLWQFFRPAYGNLYHRIWQFHLAYAFFCQMIAVLVLLGFVTMDGGVAALSFLRLMIAIELILILIVCIKDTVTEKDPLAGIYLLGFFPVILTGIHSILVGFGILKSSYSFVPLALIIFILCLEIVQRRKNILLQEKLKAYASELELKSNEKTELIKDLHDGIGGTVTNIKFISQMALQKHSQKESEKSLSIISELSGNCMTEISSFMQSLDEDELSWENLMVKMTRLGETKLEPIGVKVNFSRNIDPSLKKPNSLLYLNVLRVFQEALTNIAKHSKASHVVIRIKTADNRICMVIQDDGIGFGEGIKPNGRGLANMKARVRKFNGTFDIESQNGTQIKVEMTI